MATINGIEVEIITDPHIYVGCCPTAIRHADDAGYVVLGVAVITMRQDGSYDAVSVDEYITAQMGRDCQTDGEGDEDDAGHYVTPIIAID